MWGVVWVEQRSGHYGWLLAGYVPDKGDIGLLDFDPSAGKEIIKRRLALVISRQSFNDHTGFSMVAPITRLSVGWRWRCRCREISQ